MNIYWIKGKGLRLGANSRQMKSGYGSRRTYLIVSIQWQRMTQYSRPADPGQATFGPVALSVGNIKYLLGFSSRKARNHVPTWEPKNKILQTAP